MWSFTAKYITMEGIAKYTQKCLFDTKEKAEEYAKGFIYDAYKDTDPYALKNLTGPYGNLLAHTIIIGQKDGGVMRIYVREEESVQVITGLAAEI